MTKLVETFTQGDGRRWRRIAGGEWHEIVTAPARTFDRVRAHIGYVTLGFALGAIAGVFCTLLALQT